MSSAGGSRQPDFESGNGEATQELRLDLPAAHSAARMARHMVRQFARTNGLAEAELDHLVLVADELMTNAVDHGGGNGTLDEADLAEPVRMRLRLAVSADGWQLSLSDQGGGDPDALQALLHPDALPDLDDERGRGFFLMSRMVDSMRVRRSSDGLGLELIASRRVSSERG